MIVFQLKWQLRCKNSSLYQRYLSDGLLPAMTAMFARWSFVPDMKSSVCDANIPRSCVKHEPLSFTACHRASHLTQTFVYRHHRPDAVGADGCVPAGVPCFPESRRTFRKRCCEGQLDWFISMLLPSLVITFIFLCRYHNHLPPTGWWIMHLFPLLRSA